MQRFLKHDEPSLIWTGKLILDGRLTVPDAAAGLILMAGLGGTFQQDTVRSLAAHFHDNGFATLIADLLTPDEQQFDARTRHYRADLPLLAERIAAVADWSSKEEATHGLPLAFFGSGLVGSAALLAEATGSTGFFALAIHLPRLDPVRNLVSDVKTPALFIIDETSVAPRGVLGGETRVETVPFVTSLLESNATLQSVARKTLVWFRNHVPESVAAFA